MKRDEKTPDLGKLRGRHRRLARKLSRLGPILVGTITPRTLLLPDPDLPGRKRAYGPYYQWTFKQKGKTVTVTLTERQAAIYQKAIDRHRALEAALQEMRNISLQILESTTQGVIKRKPQSLR